jgi:serine/threonine protein kinase
MPYELLLELIVRDRCGDVPYIVPIVETIITPTKYAIVMPYLKDGDLWQLIKQVCEGTMEPISREAIRHIVRDLLCAVAHMHKCRIAHRDIKDANVLIKPNGTGCMLCDFSLSSYLKHVSGDRFVPFTEGYRPPEVLAYAKRFEGDLDLFAADVYVTGCIIAKLIMVMAKEWVIWDTIPGRCDVEESTVLQDPSNKHIYDAVLWMMETKPQSRPTADDILRAICSSSDQVPPAYIKRPKPQIPELIVQAARVLAFGLTTATIATELFNATSRYSDFYTDKQRALLSTAMAAKITGVQDEWATLSRFPSVRSRMKEFENTLLHDPQMLSALHRCA